MNEKVQVRPMVGQIGNKDFGSCPSFAFNDSSATFVPHLRNDLQFTNDEIEMAL